MAGGEGRELLRVKEPETIACCTWTPDSRYIVLFLRGRNAPQEPKRELRRITAEGGPPEKLGLAMEGLDFPRFHPDGRRLAFSAGQYKSEAWVMENFLPMLKASR